jgi:hypothetical protein
MIPLYGFLEGDTIGLLMLGHADETVATLAERLQISARVRVAHQARVSVIHDGHRLDPSTTLARAGLNPLDRFDVIAATEDDQSDATGGSP